MSEIENITEAEDIVEPVEVESAEDINEKLNNEILEWKNKYMYLLAEYDNYRKRVKKEKEDFNKYKNEEVLKSLIDIYENFEKNIINEPVCEATKIVWNMFDKAIKDAGLQKMDIKEEDPYNDDMEAISSIHIDDKEPNTIANVVANGYMLKDKIIKYPKVIVYN